MAKSHVILSAAHKAELSVLLHQSGLRSKVFKRISALLELDKGKTIEEVRAVLGLSYPAVATRIKGYKTEGLDCLKDKKQSGRPPQINGHQRAAITALACSEAPEGHARWTLHLLAGKVVKLNYCDSLSHQWAGQILKKRTEAVLKVSWCISKVDPLFWQRWKMYRMCMHSLTMGNIRRYVLMNGPAF